jgi:hypothetical protein
VAIFVIIINDSRIINIKFIVRERQRYAARDITISANYCNYF